MKRESFGSRIGFLLVSAGCAIGIGNVWRFPFVTGQNGGGIFVLLYLFFLLCMGVPVLTMELAVGRAGKKSLIGAYQNLEKPGAKWHLHGYAAMIGNYLLMMYYTTVSGWMVSYFVKFVTGTFHAGMSAEETSGVFGAMLASPGEMTFWMAATVILGFMVCSLELQGGVERVTKWMMGALLVLIIVLAGHSLLLSGTAEGLKFYLIPNLKNVETVGFGNVVMAAMSQAFFTLSLGIGSMEIFGSYMSDENTLASEAIRICGLDTFVAIMAGFIIFPACFTFGVEPAAGPQLIFITLPNVFVNMAGGRIWGTLFFLFMTFASFSTVIAVFENISAFWRDTWGWSRKGSALLNGALLLIGSVPCVLGYNLWSHVQLIGARDVLDSEDFIVSNLLLPLGVLCFLLFCTTRLGWNFDKYLEEANKGRGMKLPTWIKPIFKYVLPILTLVIFIQGLL